MKSGKDSQIIADDYLKNGGVASHSNAQSRQLSKQFEEAGIDSFKEETRGHTDNTNVYKRGVANPASKNGSQVDIGKASMGSSVRQS